MELQKFEVLINKYSTEIIKLKSEMKNFLASIPWGIKLGKIEAYENIIKDLRVKCSMCSCDSDVKFIEITSCYLCKNCKQELTESFECAIKIDRSDYPEL